MKVLCLCFLVFLFLPHSVIAEVPEGFSFYQVRRGDSFAKIAPSVHWELIKRVNRIDEHHLTPGQKILIPSNPEKAKDFCPVARKIEQLVCLPRVIFFFLDIQYFGVYENGKLTYWGPISSGRARHETPEGVYAVKWKSKAYVSRKYDNAPMPFAVNISDAGYFIHQQALPGRPASHGCLRLLKEDARLLFEWTKKGDPVIITKAADIFKKP